MIFLSFKLTLAFSVLGILRQVENIFRLSYSHFFTPFNYCPILSYFFTIVNNFIFQYLVILGINAELLLNFP